MATGLAPAKAEFGEEVAMAVGVSWRAPDATAPVVLWLHATANTTKPSNANLAIARSNGLSSRRLPPKKALDKPFAARILPISYLARWKSPVSSDQLSVTFAALADPTRRA